MTWHKGILTREAGINDADYKVCRTVDGKKILCPIYYTWKRMLSRVYNEASLRSAPTYKGCSVCDEWLLFSNFKLWMVCQDGEGKELDKDILVLGNKEYSPEACCFVSRSLNNLLTHNHLSRGEYPTGVHFSKSSRKYIAKISIVGRQIQLGYFSTPELAEAAYIKAKAAEIRRQGRKQTDSRIMIGLFRHARALEQKLA